MSNPQIIVGDRGSPLFELSNPRVIIGMFSHKETGAAYETYVYLYKMKADIEFLRKQCEWISTPL